jgi:hypothetical protein
MRPIEGKLPEEICKKIEPNLMAGSDGYEVHSFRSLVELVAKIAYLNKDYLLFFRGQNIDHLNKVGKSTFYPAIYRDDYLRQRELDYRFELLVGACQLLIKRFEDADITGTADLRRRKLIQWSILQHYEVCSTPLLDFTQSLQVAASFAQLGCDSEFSYVYAFGMPYLMNRISINSEHELVNIRLLSICPPEALRPYFQEGYLAGTEDIENKYDSKSELDFNNRLIAKFRIRNSIKFWSTGLRALPKNALYPPSDKVQDICYEIMDEVKRGLHPGQIGDFLSTWSSIESILDYQADFRSQNKSTLEAIRRLRGNPKFDDQLIYKIDSLRRFRNQLVHSPVGVGQDNVRDNMILLDEVLNRLKQISGDEPIASSS